MPVNTSDIVKLREQTCAGMMDCKQALDEACGDIGKAAELLRKKGIAKAAKRAGKVAAEGIVASYIHGGGKIGVLVEVNCETDFVAKTDAFKALINDITMHIAAVAPRYVSRDAIPLAEVEKEKEIQRAQLKNEGKSAGMVEKIIEGKLSKYYSEIVLLEQPFIKNEDKTIEELLAQKSGEIGEKIFVRRFARYELGEGIEREKIDFVSDVRAQL